MIRGRHGAEPTASREKEARYTEKMRGGVAWPLALGIVSAALTVPEVEAGAAPAPGGAAQSFWSRAASAKAPKGANGETIPWFVTAVERTAQGRYVEAAAAYGMALAAGADAPALYANLGEVLMADGQLGAAEACYRDAVAAASVPRLPNFANFPNFPNVANLAGVETRGAPRFDDLRGRTQDLTLAYLGLAVALDRDGQTRAAREMMQRALALDATASVLAVAQLPNSELFFVPAGDVYYYVGLARAVAGRREEAADAFRQFLAHQPGSRWAMRAAGHLSELGPGPAPGSPRSPSSSGPSLAGPEHDRRSGPRVLAVGTVLSTGGSLAPLIDAAWRQQGAILDDCLGASPELATARAPVRLAVEVTLDGRGRVSSAVVKLSPAAEAWSSADSLSRCLKTAIETRLRLPAPPTRRPTRARTELLIGLGPR
jgi:tetratricopeptide (TPR) repeat protein